MVRHTTVAAAGLMLGALAGCQSGGVSPPAGPAPTATATGTAAPGGSGTGGSTSPRDPGTKITGGQIGATVDLTGNADGEKIAVQLVAVYDPATPLDSSSAPAQGDRLIAFEFTFTNVGTSVYNDQPTGDATLVDAAGDERIAATSEVAAGAEMEYVTILQPGQSSTGFINFEVPRSWHSTSIRIILDGQFAPDEGTWQLPG